MLTLVHLLHLQTIDKLHLLCSLTEDHQEVVLVIFEDTIQHFCFCDQLLGEITAEQEFHQFILLHL